jgi:hypothetical protein
MFHNGVSQTRFAPGPAATRNRLVALGVVVVGQLFTGLDSPGRANPDRLIDDVDPTVGLAGVIDESRDVAVNVGITAPRAIDTKHPDATFAQVAILAVQALFVRDQLTGVIDDPLVLVDWVDREYAEAV